jgi:peroxiredoxin
VSILRRISRLLGTEGEMTDVNSGNRAPAFSVTGLDGKSYSLSSLLEKGPVVAAFFKVSCPVCQFTFPFLERLFKTYGRGEVTFVGISQDDAKATKDFAHKFSPTFPMALDEKGYPASNAYGLSMVPTVFLIDPDGTVRISSMGFVKQDLEAIAKHLAARSKMASSVLFRPDERIPEQKPG